jgi:LCP family protein required for cell wall assembly
MAKKVRRRSYHPPIAARKRKWWLIASIPSLVVIGFAANSISRDPSGQTAAQKATGKILQAMASPDLLFSTGSGDRVNLLIMGVDVNRDRKGQVTPEPGRTDTLLLVTLDRYFNTARGLSIPRDLRVEIPNHAAQKINAAHALGGPLLLIETVQKNLCIPVHHYIRTNFQGLVSLVDALGGVELYVEKDMDYDDNWGQLHIHLKQGWQVLDGEKAHQYIRFRHDRDGDLGRIRRQQKLGQAIAKKILSPAFIFQLPALMEKAQQFITTDMTRRELMSLAGFLRGLQGEQIEFFTLPVYSDGKDLLPRKEEATELLLNLFGSSFDQYAWEALFLPEKKPSSLSTSQPQAPGRASSSVKTPQIPPRTAVTEPLDRPDEIPSLPEEWDSASREEKTPDTPAPSPPTQEIHPPIQETPAPPEGLPSSPTPAPSSQENPPPHPGATPPPSSPSDEDLQENQ